MLKNEFFSILRIEGCGCVGFMNYGDAFQAKRKWSIKIYFFLI